MNLTAQTRILITTPDHPTAVTGTVGGLISHHKRMNPNSVRALEQRLHDAGRLHPTPDVRESALDHNINRLTLEDLEALETGATISLAPTQS